MESFGPGSSSEIYDKKEKIGEGTNLELIARCLWNRIQGSRQKEWDLCRSEDNPTRYR